MGRRYLCEYCDKSFPDNPANRRNHLSGVQHRALYKQHYDSFQDPEILLVEDSGKRPCRQFQQEGSCKFGSACRYSHLGAVERERLKATVGAQQDAKRRRDQSRLSVRDGPAELSDWLEKRRLRLAARVVRVHKQAPKQPGAPSTFEMPQALRAMTNLPPSLLPPSGEDLNLYDAVDDWG